MDLTQKIPSYITEKKNIVRLILFTAFFALVFINLYSPFEVNKWIVESASRFYIENTNLLLLVSSSLIILTGVLVVVISRVLLFHVTRRTGSINLIQYLIWIAIEIFLMSMFYALYERAFLGDTRSFLSAYKISIQNTALVILLPYSISWLYLSWIEKKHMLEKLKERDNVSADNKKMIVFYDEKGTMRLSIKFADLLYLQAADNYVNIVYSNKDKQARYMLRSSLKLIEEEHKSFPLVRCHRSYMVNFEKVKIIRREKDGLHILLDETDPTDLPVSKTYIDEVFKAFGHNLEN